LFFLFSVNFIVVVVVIIFFLLFFYNKKCLQVILFVL